MKASINVDIGGTFTDCFVSLDGKHVLSKVPTTGYNLAIGFMRALKESARLLGMSLEELLQNTETIRYSTTLAMNTLLQRSGPKLGMFLTEGFEDTIPIGRGASWMDAATIKEIRNIAGIQKPEPLIPREMTVGLKERVDYLGRIIRPLDEDDVLEKLRYLVDRGARGFVVSLLFSYLNPAHERKVKEIINREYPQSYLGAFPVMLSTEVIPKRLEYARTSSAILNAYLHQAMWYELSGMWDELRDNGYKRSMMMVHNTGGMAEVFRTAAIQTYNGGPVAGLIGASHVAKTLGHDNVVVSDMGGTSFDIGVVVGGSARFYQWYPVIDRWLVNATMLETRSIGAGGGSIARINKLVGNRLEVGPQSAGSMPGPAAYDLGGKDPTVTDADIVLGYINSDYYHGGRMTLRRERAAQAIREGIADPLQIDVIEAASLIKKIVDANMGATIAKETYLRGYDPKDFVVFAYGGAGPTHCVGYSSAAGIDRMIVFPYSPVFCAFGSATLDLTHFYEQSKRIPLVAPRTKEYLQTYDEFNEIVSNLQKKAIMDIEGEGFPADRIVFNLQLDIKYATQLDVFRVTSPRIFLHSVEDAKAVYEEYEREFSQVYSSFSVYPEAGVEIHNFVLRASVPQPKLELPVHPAGQKSAPPEAFKGEREVYWEEYKGFHPTPIYEERLLQRSNTIEGPAVVEAEDTTTVLPPGYRLSVDLQLNLVIKKA